MIKDTAKKIKDVVSLGINDEEAENQTTYRIEN